MGFFSSSKSSSKPVIMQSGGAKSQDQAYREGLRFYQDLLRGAGPSGETEGVTFPSDLSGAAERGDFGFQQYGVDPVFGPAWDEEERLAQEQNTQLSGRYGNQPGQGPELSRAAEISRKFGIRRGEMQVDARQQWMNQVLSGALAQQPGGFGVGNVSKQSGPGLGTQMVSSLAEGAGSAINPFSMLSGGGDTGTVGGAANAPGGFNEGAFSRVIQNPYGYT